MSASRESTRAFDLLASTSKLSREGPLVQVKAPPFANAGLPKRETWALSQGQSPKEDEQSSLRHPLESGMQQSTLPLLGEEQNDIFSLHSNAIVAGARNVPTASHIDKTIVSCLSVFSDIRDWNAVADAAVSLFDSGKLTEADRVHTKLFHSIALLQLRRIEEAESELNIAKSIVVKAPMHYVLEFLIIRLGVLKGTITSETAIQTFGALLNKLNDTIRNRKYSHNDLNAGVDDVFIWRRRVQTALASMFVRRRKWRNALAELQSVDEELAMTSKAHGKNIPSSENLHELLSIARGEINSRIGHIFLHIGNLKHSALFFQRAEGIWNPINKPRLRAKALINRGLLTFAQGDFRAASELNEKASMEARVSREISATHFHKSVCLPVGIEMEGAGTLVAISSNNAALAHLYACDVSSALSVLQNMIKESPVCAMRDATVYNLCALYDLSEGPSASKELKLNLKEFAQRSKLDDISNVSFRL